MRTKASARGTIRIEKHLANGDVEVVERIANAMVGQEVLITRIADIAGSEALGATSRLRVNDTGDAEILPATAVDAGYPQHTGGNAFATWQWTIAAGAGTGAWDDIYVQTAGADVVSQFLAQNGTIGTKGAGDAWIITYELTIT